MDRLVAAAVCGVVAAVLFGVLGALYGGLVRFLAKLRDRVPDQTPAAAYFKGLKGGGIFLAVLGALFGVLVGLIEPSAEARLQALGAAVGTLGQLMAGIVLYIAVPTTVLVWAALRYRRWQSQTPVGPGGDDPQGLAAQRGGSSPRGQREGGLHSAEER